MTTRPLSLSYGPLATAFQADTGHDFTDPQAVVALSLQLPKQVSGIAPPFDPRLPPDPIAALPVGSYGGQVSPVRTPPETAVPSIGIGSYFATEDFTTAPTDGLLPNTWFDGRITSAGSLTRSVGLTALDAPALANQRGDVAMANADARLDDAPDDPDLQGAEALMIMGKRGTPLETWITLFAGRVETVDIGTDAGVLSFIGSEYRFDEQYPLTKYAGTGDAEGPAELADTLKPHLLGRCYNVTATLVDPVLFIFQVSDTPLAAITAVRFGGAQLLFTTNYPTYAALKAATVDLGYYATCRSGGYVKAGLTQGGLSNSFVLTVDAETAVTQAADIAAALMNEAAAVLDVDVLTSTFTALKTAFPGYTYGNFITSSVTWKALIDSVMTCMNAYWGAARDGSIAAAWFDIPNPSSAIALDLQSYDILSVERLGLPAGFEWPHRERTVRYRKNWTVLNAVAAIVDDVGLSTEWKKVGVASPTSARNYITPEVFDTYLQNYNDARRLCDRLIALHGALRSMYSVVIPMEVGMPALMSQVRVTYNRLGLSAGRLFIVVATTEDYEAREVRLTLWG